MGSQSQTGLSDWTELAIWTQIQTEHSSASNIKRQFLNLYSFFKLCVQFWIYVLIRHTEFTYILPVSSNLPHITPTSNSQISAAHRLQKPVGTVITQFSSQSGPTLSDPMDCSTPGFPVYHQLPELAQTHVHRVGDAIQPSHPLSSPSASAFSLSQHHGLFQLVISTVIFTTVIISWGFPANSLLFFCVSCVFPFVYAFNASFSFFQTTPQWT